MGKYIDGNGLTHFMGILKGVHATFVTAVSWDSSNKKIKRTINGAAADVVQFVAGDNVSLTGASGSLTIAATGTDTKNTAGSTDSSSKLFLIGATSQAANPQTYSQDTVYAGTDGHVYSNSKQAVNLSDSQALTNKTYNGYTLGDACAKGVDTSISSGSSSTNLPTTAAIVQYVGEIAGALVYKGAVAAESALLNTALKAGWFYIVSTAGSYGGNVCEPGDMIIVNTSGTYTTSSALGAKIDVIQTNIDTLSNAEIDTLWAAA